jgi:hypothetical protein
MKSHLSTILEKLRIIEEAVFSLKTSYEVETTPSSPVLISDIAQDASFSLFGSPEITLVHKQLTLKQLVCTLTNLVLIRIEEVLQMVVEKINLVKTQITDLENQISQTASLQAQLTNLTIVPANSCEIKTIEGE